MNNIFLKKYMFLFKSNMYMLALLVLLSTGVYAQKSTEPLKAPSAHELPVDIPDVSLPFELSSLPYNPQTAFSARESLLCDKVWKGPSAKNDVIKCLTDQERARAQIRSMIIPIVNAALFVLILVSFPIIFLFALCCRSCCAPNTRRSMDVARCCIWMWIIYALLWGLLVFVLIIFGAKLLMASVPKLVDDTLAGPVHYFNSTAENIINFMSNWTTGERRPIEQIPLDITPFTTVQNQVIGTLDDARKTFFKYLDIVSMVSYAVGATGFALMLFIIPFACCHCCIPCFPMCISCIYWIFGALFAILGVILNAMSFTFAAGCGEIKLQHERKPGVFQWYVVPYCQTIFDFRAINKVVREAEVSFSNEACGRLLQTCDNEENAELDKLFSGINAVTAEFPSIPKSLASGNGGLTSLSGLTGSGGASTPRASGGAGGVGGGLGALAPGGKLPEGLAGALPGGLPAGINPSNLPAGINPDLLANLPASLPASIPKDFNPKSIPEALLEFIQQVGNGSAKSLKPLKCGGGITRGTDCNDFGTMAQVLLSTKIKGFTTACPEKGKSCSLVECAFNCTIPAVTTIARVILEAATLARNASVAITYAKPLLEWNFVIDKIAGGLETCNDFRTGTLMLGLGFLTGTLMFALSIYIMFRGSCIWGSLHKKKKKEKHNPK